MRDGALESLQAPWLKGGYPAPLLPRRPGLLSWGEADGHLKEPDWASACPKLQVPGTLVLQAWLSLPGRGMTIRCKVCSKHGCDIEDPGICSFLWGY